MKLMKELLEAKEPGIVRVNKLAQGVFIYLSDEDVGISWEDSKIDTDVIEQVIDVYKDVPRKNQVDRGITAADPAEALKIMNVILKNFPSTFTKMEQMNLTKGFKKELGNMVSAVQTIINKLQDIISRSE